MEVRKISEEHIQKYRSDILRSSSASTFDRKIFSLKKFFEWAVKEGYIDESPVEQFLKNEQNVIEQSLGKIEKQRKLTTPSYSSIQSRIIAKFAGKPKLQKLVYNLFYKRPQWYLTYHNLPIASYFNYAILFLLMSAVGYGAYNQFFKRTSEPLAYPTALTAPSRFLSFQGRLTDKNGNPITAVTNLEFKLYNASQSGTLLWNSGTCSIAPDPDGIFSTLLGSSCGSEIASSVFTENAAVWLGAKVGTDAEATPRVQIATVAYALNSETLQGFPASMSATANTVPVINNSGYLVLGASSPKLQSTSGTFAIEGQALTITTPNTSNGSIAINPDGTGTLNLTFEGAAPGGAAQGFVNATNANLTSQALYYGEVANDATGYNLLELASGTTPRTKFAVDSGGNATLSGTINGLAISGGNVTTGVWNATAIGTQYGGTGQNWSSVAQGSIPYFNGTGTMNVLAPTTSNYVLTTQGASANPQWKDVTTLVPAATNHWQLASNVLAPINTTDDLAIGGNATASAKFQVMGATGNIYSAGSASISGNLTLGNGSALQSVYGPLTLNYKSGANAWSAGLTVDDITGYVGIGTVDPSSLLHVKKSGDSTGMTIFESNNHISQQIKSTYAVDNTAWAFTEYYSSYDVGNGVWKIGKPNGTTNFAIGKGSSGQFYDADSILALTKTGYVGIGTTTPLAMIDVNGTASASASLTFRSGAATVGATNMSDLTLGSATTGNVVINSRGSTALTANGTSLTAGGNVNLTASTNLIFGGTTSLGETTSPTDSGAYIVGVNDEFTYATHTTVQGVLKDFDTQLGTVGTNYWRLAGNVLAPTQIAYDLVVGGSATGSAFQVFAQTGNVTLADLVITGGNINPSANLTIGDNGDTLTLDSSDWDIGATGDMTGIGAITADGTISFTGTTIGLGTSNSVTTVNVASGTGGNTVNIAGSGATGLDTINIGTGATGADVVNIGSANAGAVTIRSNAALGLTGSTGSYLTFPNFAVDTNGIITKIDNVAHTIDDVSGNLTLTSNSNTISLNDNTSVVGYATASASLALGNTSAAVGPGNLNMSGNLNVMGNTTLGDATSDTVTFTGRVASNVLPSATATYDLGSSTGPYRWNNIYGTTIYQGANQVCDSSGTGCPASTAVNFWQLGSNILAPVNVTNDLAIGGNATASAKFQVMGSTGNISTANNTVDWTLNNAADALNFDSDTLSIDALNNRVGIGAANPAVKFEIRNGATNQLRLSYDTSNYTNLYTTSTGVLTITPTGKSTLVSKSNTTNVEAFTLDVDGPFSTTANTTYNAFIRAGGTISTDVTGLSFFQARQNTISNATILNLAAYRTSDGGSDNTWMYCNSGTCASSNIWGLLIDPSVGAAGGTTYNVLNDIGVSIPKANSSNYGGNVNITTRTGLSIGGIGSTNTAVTNNYVIDIAAQTGQSTTNNYGIRIGNITNGTNNYAIYTGSGKVRFGDDVSTTGYATVSASLALGNTTAAKGPGHLNMSGDLRVGGNVYLGNNQIMNSGDVNLIALTSNPQLTPSYLYSSWSVSNGAAGNPGLASLIVDQTKSGDLFTASASGIPKFTINSNGNIVTTGTITGLTGITSSGTINFSGLTASRALFTDASSNLSSTGTSAMIANAISDETGSAGLVFQNQPSFTGYIATPIVYGSIVTTNGLTLAGNNWTGNTATAANITLKVGDSAGTTAMTILNNANVGIGTTAPTTLLGVAGTASISGTLTLGNGSSNAIQSAYGPLTLNYKSGADAWTAGLSLTNSGYVGIGTTAPQAPLQVISGTDAHIARFGPNDNSRITLYDNTSGGYRSIYNYDSAYSGLNLGHATTAMLYVDGATGNVGIGTSSPLFSFDVRGSSTSTVAAQIANSAGLATNAVNGLQVKIGANNTNNAGTDDRWITFARGDGTVVGKIRGTASASVNYDTAGVDYAEYFTKSEDVNTAELICLGDDGKVRKCNSNIDKTNIVGVVSASPGFSGGVEGPDKALVGLLGQVPLKVTTQNGPIRAGDPITYSSVSGVGAKAVNANEIVGKALENYYNPDPNAIEEISIYLNPSWYDPDVHLTSTGDLNIAQVSSGGYQLSDSFKNNSVIDRIGAFAEVAVANIKSGLINTIDIVALGSIQATNFIAKNINTGAATIGDLTVNTFTAFQGTVDNLLVKSGLVAGNIQTAMISPIPGEDLTVNLPQDSEFKVQDANGNEVASIDSGGNATFVGTINSQQLTIDNEATIGGTLYADNIKSKSLDDIEALLTQVQTDQNLLKEAADWSVLTSTNSANLDQLVLTDLYVTNQVAVNSLSVTNYLSLGNDFVIQTDLGVNGEMLATSINTLTSPLKIQSLAMAPIEIMAGLIKIDTSGNVQIAGNLAVAGNIESGSLTLKGSTSQGNVQNPILYVKDAIGDNVASVDASGSAKFNSISTQGLTIAGASSEATTSAIVDGVITSNATAGSAIIPAGSSEITIKNANITDYTLVYVTPTSTTNNYVLYVKSKGQGQFVVGFTNPIDVDVNFNWWIVKVSN